MDARGYWLTRLLLERGIGIICLIAFTNALNQFRPLLGEHGLLPVPLFVKTFRFHESPSLFYFLPWDFAFAAAAWLGIVLSCSVITGLPGRLSWPPTFVWAVIYLLYLSFVNVGQTFYGFGWESILLEACFFAIFLGGSKIVPEQTAIWMFRWLLFRIMFGAGLIKMRGDSCWRDLTCLSYHYETQPMPNPLSWYFHWAPQWLNKGGVLFNHFAELIVPFAYFLPQPLAGCAGVLTILFQLSIIASGNLSWLNWMTLVLAFSTLDAKFLSHVAPITSPVLQASAPAFKWLVYGVAALVAMMSIPVVANMFSRRQIMNTSFNSLHLVGTYGAFGSITRTRYEIVVEGTSDAVVTRGTRWLQYEFKGKPGNAFFRPPLIAPYHLRLDWLMWFAAMSNYQEHPWFVNLMAKLLQGDRAVLSLMRSNPFEDHPPRHVRALIYEYHFTTPAEKQQTGAWWSRSLAGEYFPSISMEDPAFRRALESEHWLSENP